MTSRQKGILGTLGAFGLLTASLLQAAPDVVARIGELTISVEDYERRALELRKTGYGHLEEWDQAGKEEVLDGIIARELLILEGLRLGLHQDSTIAAAVSREEQKALMNRLYDAEALRGTYTSSDEELRAFFAERRYDREVYSRHIVCRTQDEAHRVLAALDDGIPFEALVPRYSLRSIQDRFGPGGWVGWFKVGELLDELREPLATMDEGRFHPEPVKTSLGYHVFGLKERRAVDFEEAREFVAEQLRVQKRADDMERYVVQLRRRYQLQPNPQALATLHTVPEGEEVWGGPRPGAVPLAGRRADDPGLHGQSAVREGEASGPGSTAPVSTRPPTTWRAGGSCGPRRAGWGSTGTRGCAGGWRPGGRS